MTDWLYADYLEIDRDFIEIYTEEEDRKRPGAWKSFIPQENMRRLLESVTEVLDRKTPKPPFIYGPYGTGKTFTAFVLKHLLEDGLDEIEPYFTRYSTIKHLWPRWKALRDQGQYLVVYRSAATDATTPFNLAYVIQEHVTRTLKEKGFKILVTETLRQEVLKKLTDPGSTFNWPRAFEKHSFRFKDCMNPEEVINRLKSSVNDGPDVEQALLDLTNRMVHTLAEEHFVVLHTIEKLKEWLKEVVARIGLRGIVFLWDEFTDFFKIPGAPIDAVQELAHLAAETPFYLGLITHQAPDIIIKVDQESRAKFLQRFHRHYLELANVTAYRLMGGVLQVKAGRLEEWEHKRLNLWSKVENVSPFVIGLKGETKDDIRNLVPIHPYTALLLAAIARQFSSSQRTLFRFLKEEQAGHFSFPRFLREYPWNGWYWLTVDCLWDYFYAEDDPEYAEEVRRFIAQYRVNVERIGDEVERRVYKAVLLLDLLHRRVGGKEQGDDRSFEPTRSRLERVFEGVLERTGVRTALAALCSRHLLQRYAVGENEGYTLPLNLLDEERVKQIKERIEKTNSFRDLAKKTGEIGRKLSELLQLPPPLGIRQKLHLAAAEELKLRRERILPQEELELYQFGVVVVLPFEVSELSSAKELAQRLSGERQRVAYAVANQVFGEQRWKEWLENKALAEYARDVGEKDNIRHHDERAQKIIEEWAKDVFTGEFQMYFQGRDAAAVTGREGYERFLEEVVEELYRMRPEKIFRMETFYTGSVGKSAAEIGLGLVSKPQRPFSDAVEQLSKQGVWGNKDWPADHSLTQMKAVITEYLKQRGEINLRDAWQLLMSSPYGLMPSRIGVMLFAFLLRDFSEGNYYYDGNRCEGLNASTLAALIDSVVKNGRGADRYEIRQMLPAEERACRLLQELFGLKAEEARYLRPALIALRSRLKKLGYPLWALRYAGSEPCPEAVSSVLETLQVLLTADLEAGVPEREKVEILERQLARAESYLEDLVSQKSRYEAGMRCFVEREDPVLMKIAGRLGLDISRLVDKLRDLLQEDVAFWEEEKVKKQLEKLRNECRMTVALNELCGGSARELLPGLEYLRREWLNRFGKLPLWLMVEAVEGEIKEDPDSLCEQPESYQAGRVKKDKEALDLLRELFEAKSFDPVKDFDRLSNWADRSGILAQDKEFIRQRLSNQAAVLCCWARERLGVGLSTEDAGKLLEKLPGLWESRREEVAGYIHQYQVELERQQLVAELRQRWQELTGSFSPAEWSRKAGLPAHFLVDKAMERLLDLMDRLEKKSESELREARQTLEQWGDVLGSFRSAGWVKKTFLERVAGDYAELVENDEDLAALKEHLQRETGEEFSQWDLAQAQTAVKEWAQVYYRQVGYQRVKARLDKLSRDRARELLGELAQDPLVGVKLLRKS